jgi:hypothetical protein
VSHLRGHGKVFINFPIMIGLQKSLREIHGLFFLSLTPLALNEIVNRLDISLGAATARAVVAAVGGNAQRTVRAGTP